MTDVPMELVPVDKIDHHPQNPRQDIGDVSDLADSIRSVGVLQPIAVHKAGRRFVCLMGNRRLAAAKVAGLEVVPAMVWHGLSGEQQVVVMLVENLQRDDLNPLDEADALAELQRTGMEQGEIGSRVGRSQSFVSRRLRLLELGDEAKAKVRAGKLSANAALRTLTPKKERPKAEPEERAVDPLDVPAALDVLSESTERSDIFDALYSDAAPLVREVRDLIIEALQALLEGRLPAAGAAIGTAHRRLFPFDGPPTVVTDEPIEDAVEAVAEQNAEAAEADLAVALAEAEQEVDEELSEAVAIAIGTEQIDPSLEAVDPDVEAVASIHQLRSSPDPVSRLAGAMANAMANGEGEAAPAVTVTIGPPDGSFSTRIVECQQHGRLTRTPEIDFARSKAQAHIDERHGGMGDVVVTEEVSA